MPTTRPSTPGTGRGIWNGDRAPGGRAAGGVGSEDKGSGAQTASRPERDAPARDAPSRLIRRSRGAGPRRRNLPDSHQIGTRCPESADPALSRRGAEAPELAGFTSDRHAAESASSPLPVASFCGALGLICTHPEGSKGPISADSGAATRGGRCSAADSAEQGVRCRSGVKSARTGHATPGHATPGHATPGHATPDCATSRRDSTNQLPPL
jgi:hypothetical protein